MTGDSATRDRPTAAVLVGCVDVEENRRFFVDDLGFRILLVSPADDPRRVVVESQGLILDLRRSESDTPVSIVLEDAEGESGEFVAPNGSRVTVSAASKGVDIPPLRASLSYTPGNGEDFGAGRAGMDYRDLLPDRWGGRFIASHIRIAEGGDVADWVHFHRVRFQMIFVAAGWVDVVYEDQGPPFRMTAGDCVLQPPEIRHRVLRSSPGLEVIEIGCPAEHDTIADHDLALPTAEISPDREFDGQRFVRHIAEGAPTEPWLDPAFDARDLGIGRATSGLAGATVLDATDRTVDPSPLLTNSGEFVLCVGLSGAAEISVAGECFDITPRSALAIPPGDSWRWSNRSDDHRCLVVTLGADAISKL